MSDLSGFEKDTLCSIVRGMSDEEMELTLRCYPTSMIKAELERRNEKVTSVLQNIFEIMSNCKETMTLEEMESVINGLKALFKNRRVF